MCINQARRTWGIQISEDPQFEASTNQKLETGAMCISQARPTWGIRWSKDIQFKASTTQRLGTRAVQSCWENSGYCVQCTLPITFTIFQNFQKKSVEPRHWQVTTQFIKFKPVPIYWELSFILHTKFLLFFDGNTWSKNFQNTKTFLHLLKSVNDKHTFFEFMSSGSAHPHSPRERLHSGKETGLGTVERISALSKMQS